MIVVVAYLQSGATAPLWSVLSWCSKSVLLLMVGFGGAEGAERFTPLLVVGVLVFSTDGAGVASVILLLAVELVLPRLTTVGTLEASPSIVVSIKVPIGDWIVDCVEVSVMLLAAPLLLQTALETDAGVDIVVFDCEIEVLIPAIAGVDVRA